MVRRIVVGWGVAAVIIAALGGLWWWSVANRPTYPTVDSLRPAKGSPTATVTLEEFSDFQCPACQAVQPLIAEVFTTFGDRVRFTYRHFPLVSIHPRAWPAALAAECANDQNLFWEYHDQLFENQPAFSRAELIVYATNLNLNVPSFTACIDSRAKTDVVRADMREGERRRISGTPTFFLNGEPVADWSKLKELIQAKLSGG